MDTSALRYVRGPHVSIKALDGLIIESMGTSASSLPTQQQGIELLFSSQLRNISGYDMSGLSALQTESRILTLQEILPFVEEHSRMPHGKQAKMLTPKQETAV